MSRLQLKSSVIKRLFALSGNRCAFPGCKNELVSKSGIIIGEICHIEAAEPGGERYNPNSNDEYRRSFDNLLLMCPIHHKTTNNVDDYPSQKLQEIKSNHENYNSQNPYNVSDETVEKAIKKTMEQNNNNSSGVQFNNQSVNQNITAQIGTQNIFLESSKSGLLKIEGARRINSDFKDIIDKFKKQASPPTKEVIDFGNELAEHFERDVVVIPTKYLRFRKNNGRIIAEVESYQRENNLILEENDDATQEILRQFLKNNDKEKNEELKRLLLQKGQQRPAIITCDGFLINGNRRKMALEELYASKNQNPQFEMMRVVILPDTVTELEVQKIENRYQLQSEGKSEYQGLNRAIKYKRNIEHGFSLEAQLRDDPNFHELPEKEFQKKVKEFEKNFLLPLDCVDKYLNTFNRSGMYNTVSESVNDREGRWQAFIDYSNFKNGILNNKSKTQKMKIRESEIGKLENAVFKIIRKRNINAHGKDIGKVHEFIRKLPKYLANEEATKLILKISEVPEDIPESLKYDKKGDKMSEREIDEKWGAHFKQDILGNVIQAHNKLSNQEERDKPLELLEDALKKLKHENLKIANMAIGHYDNALDLIQKIMDEAGVIYKEIDDARFKLKKLSKPK